jgi:hypothetical protein
VKSRIPKYPKSLKAQDRREGDVVNPPEPRQHGRIEHKTHYLIVSWRSDEYEAEEGGGNHLRRTFTSIPGPERISMGDLTLEEARAAWNAAREAIMALRKTKRPSKVS